MNLRESRFADDGIVISDLGSVRGRIADRPFVGPSEHRASEPLQCGGKGGGDRMSATSKTLLLA